jgi:hypothetical protein
VLSLSFLTNCTSLPDIAVCKEINLSKGFCTYTISDKEFIVDDEHKLNGKSWWEIRNVLIGLPPESWAEIKKKFIKDCKEGKKCPSEISSWDRKINKLDSAGESDAK